MSKHTFVLTLRNLEYDDAEVLGFTDSLSDALAWRKEYMDSHNPLGTLNTPGEVVIERTPVIIPDNPASPALLDSISVRLRCYHREESTNPYPVIFKETYDVPYRRPEMCPWDEHIFEFSIFASEYDRKEELALATWKLRDYYRKAAEDAK